MSYSTVTVLAVFCLALLPLVIEQRDIERHLISVYFCVVFQDTYYMNFIEVGFMDRWVGAQCVLVWGEGGRIRTSAPRTLPCLP